MGILEELKRDLVEPVKTFTEEVCDDTLGDAKRFYSAQARNMQQNVKAAEARRKEKQAAMQREKEIMKKQRKALVKRGLILLGVVAAVGLLLMTLALNHGLW